MPDLKPPSYLLGFEEAIGTADDGLRLSVLKLLKDLAALRADLFISSTQVIAAPVVKAGHRQARRLVVAHYDHRHPTPPRQASGKPRSMTSLSVRPVTFLSVIYTITSPLTDVLENQPRSSVPCRYHARGP